VGESKLSPLQHNVQIVNPDGTPTPYFIQLLQQLYEEKNDISDQVELTAGLDLIAGAGLTGGGPLDGTAGDITLSASVQAILNLVTTTRGAILYRGAAVWSALLPGTAGYFLQTAGAGADPLWAAGGGGGGGGATPTIRAHNAGVYNAASVNVPFPAGTVAGDIAVVNWENGFAVSATPAGWTPLWISNNGGTWTNQGTIAKIITAGDLATGFVTVTAGGAFNGWWGIVIVTGTTVTSFEKIDHFDSPGSASTVSAAVTGMLGVPATDLVFGFASTRSNQLMTVSANLTVVRSAVGANASGIIYTAAAAALGKLGMNETVNAPVANNGLDWSTVAFK
jgi:hypothetical protein